MLLMQEASKPQCRINSFKTAHLKAQVILRHKKYDLEKETLQRSGLRFEEY